jgi:hypothetical protein
MAKPRDARTFAGEGVDDLFLDTLLTFREALVLGEEVRRGGEGVNLQVPFLRPWWREENRAGLPARMREDEFAWNQNCTAVSRDL